MENVLEVTFVEPPSSPQACPPAPVKDLAANRFQREDLSLAGEPSCKKGLCFTHESDNYKPATNPQAPRKKLTPSRGVRLSKNRGVLPRPFMPRCRRGIFCRNSPNVVRIINVEDTEDNWIDLETINSRPINRNGNPTPPAAPSKSKRPASDNSGASRMKRRRLFDNEIGHGQQDDEIGHGQQDESGADSHSADDELSDSNYEGPLTKRFIEYCERIEREHMGAHAAGGSRDNQFVDEEIIDIETVQEDVDQLRNVRGNAEQSSRDELNPLREVEEANQSVVSDDSESNPEDEFRVPDIGDANRINHRVDAQLHQEEEIIDPVIAGANVDADSDDSLSDQEDQVLDYEIFVGRLMNALHQPLDNNNNDNNAHNNNDGYGFVLNAFDESSDDSGIESES